MKIALFGSNQLQFSKVYTPEVLKKLSKHGELSPRISNRISKSTERSSRAVK